MWLGLWPEPGDVCGTPEFIFVVKRESLMKLIKQEEMAEEKTYGIVLVYIL